MRSVRKTENKCFCVDGFISSWWGVLESCWRFEGRRLRLTASRLWRLSHPRTNATHFKIRSATNGEWIGGENVYSPGHLLLQANARYNSPPNHGDGYRERRLVPRRCYTLPLVCPPPQDSTTGRDVAHSVAVGNDGRVVVAGHTAGAWDGESAGT